MNFDQYTKRSLEAIQLMQNLAGEYGNQQLEQCHLLLALLRQEEGLTPQLLRNMGITPESLEAAARSMVEKLPKDDGEMMDDDIPRFAVVGRAFPMMSEASRR